MEELEEEVLIDEPWQRRVKRTLKTVPWRPVTVVLSLSSLVTIICLATAPSSKADDVASLLHQRVDNVVNATWNMSITHEDQEDLEYRQEVMEEEEAEEAQLSQDLSNAGLQTEITNASSIMSDMIELAQSTTEADLELLGASRSTTTCTTMDSVEPGQQDESSIGNCSSVEKFPPSEITCQASSQLRRRYGCMKAFDGVCTVGRKKNSWASKGEGVGAWIKATFSSKKLITQLKLLQKMCPGEANKEIEIEFGPTLTHLKTLEEKRDRCWNIIKLPSNILTDYVKITVKKVYGHVNNGFKEIEIYGCDYNNK